MLCVELTCLSSWALKTLGCIGPVHEQTACDLPARGSEGQQGSFILLCDPAECDPALAARTILAMLTGALQVIPLAGVHWVGNNMV